MEKSKLQGNMYSQFPVWEKSYIFTHTYMIDIPKKAEWIYNKILTRLALNKKMSMYLVNFAVNLKLL